MNARDWPPHPAWLRVGWARQSSRNTTVRVEYAESAAKDEYLNLQVGEIGEGLSPDEIRAICATLDVRQEIF